MLDLVKKVLASHKSQMDRYREQYTRSLAGELSLSQQSARTDDDEGQTPSADGSTRSADVRGS